MQSSQDERDLPSEEEQELVLTLATRIYANLMGSLDAEMEVGKHEDISGTDIYCWAAQQAIHRAEWFLPEMREWKKRINRLRGN